MGQEEKKLTFEEAMLELEQVVNKLEGGKFPLDASMQLFQRGVELSKYCNGVLDETEKKVMKLIETDGKIEETPLGSVGE